MRRLLAACVAASLPALPARAAGPVVVELFTSQGCSSCPDADRLLSSWGVEAFRKGLVLPLTFNVDYWDSLGWKDVFSAPSWSARQSRYAAAIGERTYTPQMVVAGREAFVGSDGERARAAAGRYLGEPGRARLELKSLPSPKTRVDVTVSPTSDEARGLHVIFVLFELGLLTDVPRGENAGHKLRNDFVVRRLADLGALEAGKPLRRVVEEGWNAAWRKENSGAAVFLQDPRTLAVYDAKTVFPL